MVQDFWNDIWSILNLLDFLSLKLRIDQKVNLEKHVKKKNNSIVFSISYKDLYQKDMIKKVFYHWKVNEKIIKNRVLSQKLFSGGPGLMGVFKDYTPPKSPAPPGLGLMGEGTTGVTPKG